MLAFTLHQVKHSLFIKRGKVRARVLGRMFPTIETETGRAAICPSTKAFSGAATFSAPTMAEWLADMQIVTEPRRVLQARLAED